MAAPSRSSKCVAQVPFADVARSLVRHRRPSSCALRAVIVRCAYWVSRASALVSEGEQRPGPKDLPGDRRSGRAGTQRQGVLQDARRGAVGVLLLAQQAPHDA